MNTTLLKTFGQKARTLLIDGVTRKLHYWGFDKDGAVTESPESIPGGYLFRESVFDDTTAPHLWLSLEEAINKDGLNEVAERAAYIWFNRLMALQILGKNNYEPPLLEPVSVEEQTPLLVKRARGGQYDFLNKFEQERLKKILTDYEKETQAFAILLIGFCHNHSLLNRVFGSIDDYTELLLPDDILSSGGFLDLLNNSDYITDKDYQQVELIGWLYQFYISEKKDQVFKRFKDGKKAEAKDIPAATQIFTPNWIVKYMVENTVGKIWLEKNPHSPIKESLKYLVEATNTNETPEPIIEEVKDLKLLDPASGSGHILVEGFELLYKMYLEEYYPADEAVESILQNNLYGLDIDLRAAQLAQFALLMKAAQYHPDVLRKNIIPHIHAMPAPVHFTKEDVELFLGEEGAAYIKSLQDILRVMLQAQNLGSIMQFDITEAERVYILQQFRQWKERKDLDLLQQELLKKLAPCLEVLELLTQQYEAIAANPPYMGQKNMNAPLKTYVNKLYPKSCADLMTVFMEVFYMRAKKDGFYSFINLPSWMFISTFQELRESILDKNYISSLIMLGRGIFGSDFGSVTLTIRKSPPGNKLSFFKRLSESKVKVESIEAKEASFHNKQLNEYVFEQKRFYDIPLTCFSFWLPEKAIQYYKDSKRVVDISTPVQGLATGENERFLRDWFEVDILKVGFDFKSIADAHSSNRKWFPYNKGGEFKKWYGNKNFVIAFDKPNYEVLSNQGNRLPSKQFYFKDSITWSKVTLGGLAFRLFDGGAIFDVSGCSIFADIDTLKYLMALFNSAIKEVYVYSLTQSVNYEVGLIKSVPVLDLNKEVYSKILKISEENISITKLDWDSRETSWDFQLNPFLKLAQSDLSQSFQIWAERSTGDFLQLHKNEVELNKIFIEIYGFQDELTPDVPFDKVTILQDELDFNALEILAQPFKGLLPIKKDVPIQQLISYTVGCFMGRYRLDKSGLQVAHPNPGSEALEAYTYTSQVTGDKHQIEIDEDGIIPLMGSKGNFADDAYNRLRQFLIAVWGEKTLTQNINFMQDCLNQDLEDYLVKKFWGYHVRMYSRKPIYWLFSSKKGAFQALVYMHRMNRFTAEKLRDVYLLKHIQYLEQEIARMEGNMTALSKIDQKKLDQLRKDLQECNDYDLLLKDIATKQIEFDLDDGVTHNYELFKGVVAPIK